jgi:hypothetical protein
MKAKKMKTINGSRPMVESIEEKKKKPLIPPLSSYVLQNTKNTKNFLRNFLHLIRIVWANKCLFFFRCRANFLPKTKQIIIIIKK